MRKYLFYSIILFHINGFSQIVIEGKYCTIPPMAESDITCIEFKKGNKFEYKNSGCLGLQNYGKGKFELKKDKLILSFDKIEKKYKSEINIVNLPKENSDSISLNFTILDNFGKSIRANIFKLKGPKEFQRFQANQNGICTIRNPKNNENEKYEITFIGFEFFSIIISNENSKEIVIKLAEIEPSLISNHKIIYKLMEFKSEYFITEKTKFRKVEN